MTYYTVKTTVQEADDIAKGKKNFVFRDSKKFLFGEDDEITFAAYKDIKPTRHPINDMKFRVTYVSNEAPIDDGFVAVGFRRIS